MPASDLARIGHNLPELASNATIKDAMRLVRGQLRRAVLAQLDRQLAKRTGTLRRSVSVRHIKRGLSARAGAIYARFHEYGASSTPARPFVRPAVVDTLPLAARVLAGQVAGVKL